MERGWLACESVERGMFSDERLVVVQRYSGDAEPYFVPLAEVSESERRVRVQFTLAGQIAWATLPTAQPVTIAVLPSQVAR